MNPTDYTQNVLRTESTLNPVSSEHGVNSRILHCCMGVSTEAGELLDACKKSMFYGKKLDKTNLHEEVGDIFWYSALLLHELGISFEEVMENNIQKLKNRYPEKFTLECSENRNLQEEREILENIGVRGESEFSPILDEQNHFDLISKQPLENKSVFGKIEFKTKVGGLKS